MFILGQEIFLYLFFFMFILGQEIFVYLFFFMFILGQEISSCALYALRRSHGCRFGRESWLSQVHWQRGGLQVNIAVLKKKMPKTDTLDALNDAMTTILTTNLDNLSGQPILTTNPETTPNIL